MNRWKLPLAGVLAASLMAGAVPASAATYANGAHLKVQINQLDRQIDRAEARHRISNREASMLGRQVRELGQTWRVYARGGFTSGEYRNLDRRIDAVQRNLARQMADGNNRRDHRGAGDRR